MEQKKKGGLMSPFNKMKKIFLLIIIILLIPIILISREWVIKQVLPDVGDYKPGRHKMAGIINLGNYYPKLMIPTPIPSDLYRTVVFRFTGDSFEFEINIDTLKITGIGDFDNDGLIELLGYSVAYDSSIAVMEQLDTNQVYKIRTWDSDGANNDGIRVLGSTNLLKTDGMDRIYGADPPDCDSGWYYMSSDGDNSYYFDYVLIEDREISTMDIGYIDDDSLVDVIAGTSKGQSFWEATNMNSDSFELRCDNPGWGNGTHYSGILNDIDGDGKNEFITGGINYAMSPCEWSFTIGECISDTQYERISIEYFRKDYGAVPNIYSGSDYDIGDVDGDGENEIIVCAGCILRVYEIMGNDSFVKVWEMDNDTFSGSHVRVYDFNENGIDEIIWSGAADPSLPLTLGIGNNITYIIEYAPLSKLDYSDPINMNNVSISTVETDSFYLYSIDELTIVIDSMKLLKENELTLIEPIYPCSIPAGDSIPISINIYSDSIGYITDTLIVYSNDWYGNIDTIELYAGIEVQIRIDSAIASDNRNAGTGIDYDDFVKLYFNYPIIPIDTSIIDLDVVLGLNNSHTWYDGTGNIKYISYVNNNNEMVIFLSTDTTLPTIEVGDTIEPDSVSIKDERNYSYLKKPIIITGSFDPTGINQPPAISHQPSADLTIDYRLSTIDLFYSIPNNQQTELTIYDITGREITNKIHNKQGIYKLNLSVYPKGIYFINLKTENNTITRKIIIF